MKPINKRKSCFSPIIENSGQQSPVILGDRMQTVVADGTNDSFTDTTLNLSQNPYSTIQGRGSIPKNKFAKNVPANFKTIQPEEETYQDNESESALRQQLNASQESKQNA